MAHILIINPNSSETVTRAMMHSAQLVPLSPDTHIRGATNREGPAGIETNAHVAAVVPHLEALIAAETADSYIIACFSDPGVETLRAATPCPVIGIGEAAYLAALGIGARFGIISIVQASIPRHRARLEQLGLATRLAGDRAIDVGVAELEGAGVVARLLAAGRALHEDGADSVILGCAGLGGYRPALQRALQIPVIDPVQAAVAQANAVLSLGLHPPF